MKSYHDYCCICGEIVKEEVTACRECQEAIDQRVKEIMEGLYPWPQPHKEGAA